MDPVDKESNTRLPLGFVVAIALLAGSMIVICLVALSTPRYSRLDRNDADSVAMVFVEAMALHNARMAKSLVADEQWERIDSWVSKRRVFKCPLLAATSGRSRLGVTGVGYRYDGTYRCASYYFEVDDIVMDRTDEGFVILDWGTICEGQDTLDGTRRCE